MTVKTSQPATSFQTASQSLAPRSPSKLPADKEPLQEHPVLERIEQTLDLIEEAARIDQTIGSSKRYEISLIVPVFNQLDQLPSALERIRRVMPAATEMIVVDDGSTDGSDRWLAAQSLGDNLRVIRRRRHHGRGSAVRVALRHCSGRVIAIHGNNLNQDPTELLRVIWPVLDGDAEVVFGSRQLGAQLFGASPLRTSPQGTSTQGTSTRGRRRDRFGDWLVSRLSNAMTGLRLTDAETGYRAFDAELLKSLDLRERDERFEAEITAKIANQGARMLEVPVFDDMTTGKPSPRSWSDRLAAIRCTWSYLRQGSQPGSCR